MRRETDRLILRPWEDRDRPELKRILGDATVRRYYPTVATPVEVDGYITNSIAAAERDGFHFQAVEHKQDGALVGLLGMGRLSDLMRATIAGGEVEIGWQFDSKYWGQGLAPEAALAWLDYGWADLKLPEVVAFTAAINVPSQRVMEKIGMVRNPADDFDHPRVEAGHVLRPHVVYRIGNPNA